VEPAARFLFLSRFFSGSCSLPVHYPTVADSTLIGPPFFPKRYPATCIKDARLAARATMFLMRSLVLLARPKCLARAVPHGTTSFIHNSLVQVSGLP